MWIDLKTRTYRTHLRTAELGCLDSTPLFNKQSECMRCVCECVRACVCACVVCLCLCVCLHSLCMPPLNSPLKRLTLSQAQCPWPWRRHQKGWQCISWSSEPCCTPCLPSAECGYGRPAYGRREVHVAYPSGDARGEYV